MSTTLASLKAVARKATTLFQPQPSGSPLATQTKIGFFDLAATCCASTIDTCQGIVRHSSSLGGCNAVDAADAGRRGRRKVLLPDPGFEVIGKEVKSLRNAVMATEVDPFFRERIERPGAFPAEHRRWLLIGGALLDPLIRRVLGPVCTHAKERKQHKDASIHDAPGTISKSIFSSFMISTMGNMVDGRGEK
jgi:hypothetical protein